MKQAHRTSLPAFSSFTLCKEHSLIFYIIFFNSHNPIQTLPASLKNINIGITNFLKVAPMFKHHAMKTYWGCRGIILSTRRSTVVSFTLRPSFPY